MNDINFETIRAEQSVDEMFRVKIELTNDNTDLHTELHSGNATRDKTEILGDLNYNKELIEYLNNRIKDRKQEIYIEEKEEKNRLKKFKDAARVILTPELFIKIQQESFKWKKSHPDQDKTS